MQAQVKYESEFKTAVLGDRTITVKNVTPIYPPQERDKRDREIERRLFDVYSRMQIEQLITEFAPTMLLVEHDSVFRDTVASKIVNI